MWWAAFAVLSALDIWTRLSPRQWLEDLVKPGAMLALVAVALSEGAAQSSVGILLLLALACCLLGDILLLRDSTGRFLGGLSAFLCGHLVYLGLFAVLGFTHLWWSAAALVGFLALMPLAVRIVRGAAGQDRGLGVAVTAYIAVVGAVAVLSWGTGSLLLGLGGAAFAVSDTILGWQRFVRPLRGGDALVMVTYLGAQALLVLGVLARL